MIYKRSLEFFSSRIIFLGGFDDVIGEEKQDSQFHLFFAKDAVE